jgi:ribosome-associated toxin RatA of RatAB toxin-antitoxin module
LSQVKKSVLIKHTAQQMYALVDAVEAYPQFLPWCSKTDVLHRDEQRTRATIHINYHGVRHSFTTENEKSPPGLIWIKLVEGPFRMLDGSWRFIALNDEACKIEFELHYEFANRLLEKLVGPVFAYIANTMVEAFIKRADHIHGTS